MSKIQQIPSWYKSSPLGPIPSDWEIIELWKIWNFYRGHNYDASNVKNEWLLVLRSGNIQGDNLILDSDLQYVNNTCNEKILLRKNDLVICMANWSRWLVWKAAKYNWGYTGWITVGAFCSIFRWGNTLSRYLFGSQLYKKHLHILLAWTNINNLNLSDIEKLKFSVPTSPIEQAAIANLLSTWDEAISKVSALIRQHELRKNYLIQNLLSWKKRLDGFLGEWREVKLRDIFDRVTRKNDKWNTNVVTISAQRGFVKQNDYFNKIVASEILDGYYLIRKWEFCYNKSYSNGYPWGAIKILKEEADAVVTTLYICFKLNDSIGFSLDFFEHFFESWAMDDWLTKIAHEWWRAHGLLNVTPSDFFGLKITIPGIEEQVAIALILWKADEEISLLKSKLEKLKEQKNGLMQQLLTGKKRLQF